MEQLALRIERLLLDLTERTEPKFEVQITPRRLDDEVGPQQFSGKAGQYRHP